jgi:hypothetical protein
MNKEAVLERAAGDIGFFGQLAQDYTMALEGYDLTWQERVALATGDIGRKLNEGMIMTKVLIPLLSREGW